MKLSTTNQLSLGGDQGYEPVMDVPSIRLPIPRCLSGRRYAVTSLSRPLKYSPPHSLSIIHQYTLESVQIQNGFPILSYEWPKKSLT